MPREVREAIYRYLEASGRMEGMRMGDYIFAPLAEPGVDRANDRREDWAEGRCVSMSQLLSSLKVYGRAACIAEEKLTLQCLRRTATRWRLEAGSGLEEMKSFLNSREEAKSTRHRLKQLPPLPQDDGETAADFSAPDRKAKPFKAGDGLKHGMYAHEQPVEGVLAVLKENVKGVEEEVTGLRRLARGAANLDGGAVQQLRGGGAERGLYAGGTAAGGDDRDGAAAGSRRAGRELGREGAGEAGCYGSSEWEGADQ